MQITSLSRDYKNWSSQLLVELAAPSSVMEVDLSILLVSRQCVTQEKRRVKHVSNTCQLQHTVCIAMHSYGVLQYLMEAACPLKHTMKGKLTCSGVSEQQKPI